MLLHLLYILAFTVLAFLAISNLIRNLLTLGVESQRLPAGRQNAGFDPAYPGAPAARNRPTPHPELLDETGKIINEPLLVMRSISMEDARERLDALYDSSPGGEAQEEA